MPKISEQALRNVLMFFKQRNCKKTKLNIGLISCAHGITNYSITEQKKRHLYKGYRHGLRFNVITHSALGKPEMKCNIWQDNLWRDIVNIIY